MSLPPVEIPQGAIRFNTDSQKLEFYAQDQWWEMVTDTPNLGTSSDTTAGGRGLFAGGRSVPGSSVFINTIDYINISSTGNAVDFGDRIQSVESISRGVSSNTRGIFAGGYGPSPIGGTNVIDYVTMSSTGNAQDFGDLSARRYSPAGASNQTRGLFAGGFDSGAATNSNIIDYITIASTGDAKDFGDLTLSRRYPTGVSSPSRAIFAGGYDPATNTINFVVISTLGNAVDFGDLTTASIFPSSASNSTRGLFHLGTTGWSPFSSSTQQVDYLQISTLGNSVKFGDLTVNRGYCGGLSSSTRACFGGGFIGPATTRYNIIDYVTIQTQGNAVDFGDLNNTPSAPGACSNAHGGL